LNSIGVDFRSKDINYDDKKIKLQIWDTAGEERYRTITASYYRGANAIAIVFDLTKIETFEHVKRWIEDINKYAKENVLKFLIGNKSDLIQKRQINYMDARNFACKMNITYFETSAKNNENINEFFEGATKIFISKYICKDENVKKIILTKNNSKNKKIGKKKKDENC
jgi:Ras-related protein Rab-1A